MIALVKCLPVEKSSWSFWSPSREKSRAMMTRQKSCPEQNFVSRERAYERMAKVMLGIMLFLAETR